MAFAVNDLIKEALQDVGMCGIRETPEGDIAAAGEGCLNRAIRQLNSDGYVALTQQTRDLIAAGHVYFRKLEEGESARNTIDMAPPDRVEAVGRRVGVRYVRLRPSTREALDRTQTFSYPTRWAYGVEMETAPSGATRRVGVIYTNGSGPVDLRVYVNSQLPSYRQGDMIYLSSLYYSLLLYATEMKLIELGKMYSYQDQVQRNLDGAMQSIDNAHLNNAENMGPEGLAEFDDPYHDVLTGNGF